MAFHKATLRQIYDRTSGYCHICHKKLAFNKYGKVGARSSWEVEHSNPRCLGGTDRLTNLYAACISCNRQKQAGSTRRARLANGKNRAPLNREKRSAARQQNAGAGALVGGLVGSVFGPAGALLGAALGAKAGYDKNPDTRE